MTFQSVQRGATRQKSRSLKGETHAKEQEEVRTYSETALELEEPVVAEIKKDWKDFFWDEGNDNG